jgi:hypothetical protein
MGKRKNLHINLHSSHFCKRNSLYVSYLQRDAADLKSADRNWSWWFKSPSGYHLSCLLSIIYCAMGTVNRTGEVLRGAGVLCPRRNSPTHGKRQHYDDQAMHSHEVSSKDGVWPIDWVSFPWAAG